MIKVIAKLATGFLSTAIFFTAFALAGDVLIATAIAIAGAATQFVLARTVFHRPDLMTRTASWLSVAVVLLVTVTTLVGIEPSDAATVTRHDIVTQVSSHCPSLQHDI